MTDYSHSNWVIRPEEMADIPAIHNLTKRAFAPMEYSEGDEQDLIDTLRAAGRLSLSLVAELDSQVIGHIAFSKAMGADDWHALGPISVEPVWQFKGIGLELIANGLSVLKNLNAQGCILVGDPKYYSKSGFVLAPQCCPPNQPSQYFMVRLLRGTMPDVVFQFDPAFGSH